MQLSEINPQFNNLSSKGLNGPHCSGVFFLYSWKPYLRIGFETLAGNSDEKKIHNNGFPGCRTIS